MFLFYLSQLNVQDNAVFFATYAGLKCLRKALQFPGFSKSDLSDQSGVESKKSHTKPPSLKSTGCCL